MKRELSCVDVSRISTYVESMGVDFYDVQVEIVDHIASEIEVQLEAFPERPFREVFDTTLASFDNFESLLYEKQSQVMRQYNRYFKKTINDFFRWPRLVFTAALLVLNYLVLTLATPADIMLVKDTLFWWSMGLVLGYCGFVHWRNQVQYHKLCTTHLLGWFPLFLQLPQGLILLTKYAEKYREEYTFMFALVYALSFITIWAFIEAYEKIRSYGREKYLKVLLQ